MKKKWTVVVNLWDEKSSQYIVKTRIRSAYPAFQNYLTKYEVHTVTAYPNLQEVHIWASKGGK